MVHLLLVAVAPEVFRDLVVGQEVVQESLAHVQGPEVAAVVVVVALAVEQVHHNHGNLFRRAHLKC